MIKNCADHLLRDHLRRSPPRHPAIFCARFRCTALLGNWDEVVFEDHHESDVHVLGENIAEEEESHLAARLVRVRVRVRDRVRVRVRVKVSPGKGQAGSGEWSGLGR